MWEEECLVEIRLKHLVHGELIIEQVNKAFYTCFQIIWYGVLDVLAKVVFGLILLTSLMRYRSLVGKGEG